MRHGHAGRSRAGDGRGPRARRRRDLLGVVRHRPAGNLARGRAARTDIVWQGRPVHVRGEIPVRVIPVGAARRNELQAEVRAGDRRNVRGLQAGQAKHVKGRPYPRRRANLPPEYPRQPPVQCLRPDTQRRVQRQSLPPPVDRLPQPRDILAMRAADEGIAREAGLVLRPLQCLARRLLGTEDCLDVQRQPGGLLGLQQARDHHPG